jgi:Lar family restriction alleviation protein
MSGTPERLYRVCPACGTAGAHQSGCDRADDPLPPKPVPEWLTDERERLVDALEVAVVEREAAIDTFGEAKARVNGDASIENIERVAEAEAAYDAACKRVRECRAELLRAAPPPQQTEPDGLLPCPFCGGEAVVQPHGDPKGLWRVFCSVPGSSAEHRAGCWMGSDSFHSKADAISAWNRRAAPPALDVEP